MLNEENRWQHIRVCIFLEEFQRMIGARFNLSYLCLLPIQLEEVLKPNPSCMKIWYGAASHAVSLYSSVIQIQIRILYIYDKQCKKEINVMSRRKLTTLKKRLK